MTCSSVTSTFRCLLGNRREITSTAEATEDVDIVSSLYSAGICSREVSNRGVRRSIAARTREYAPSAPTMRLQLNLVSDVCSEYVTAGHSKSIAVHFAPNLRCMFFSAAQASMSSLLSSDRETDKRNCPVFPYRCLLNLPLESCTHRPCIEPCDGKRRPAKSFVRTSRSLRRG